ncbi:MAG: hypothetical protein LRY38_01995 [Aeromonadaceae bacterium]|nr:hypothetical protein [Aeromonadaceae bacterium]
MEMQWWGPLAAFALVSSITPGPNNLMLTSAGARFGLQRTLLHVVGISAGMGLMLLLVSLGLGELFAAQPWCNGDCAWWGVPICCGWAG